MRTNVEKKQNKQQVLTTKWWKRHRLEWKKIEGDPIALSKKKGSNYHHAILYKPKNGFAFTLFWVEDKGMQGEPVAHSSKVYKTKRDCIIAIKKMASSCGNFGILSDPLNCWDYNLEPISTKIKSVTSFEL